MSCSFHAGSCKRAQSLCSRGGARLSPDSRLPHPFYYRSRCKEFEALIQPGHKHRFMFFSFFSRKGRSWGTKETPCKCRAQPPRCPCPRGKNSPVPPGATHGRREIMIQLRSDVRLGRLCSPYLGVRVLPLRGRLIGWRQTATRSTLNRFAQHGISPTGATRFTCFVTRA